jgi:hypothetical protein
MTELPHITAGHAPLDVCHRMHSGVAVHVMPGCVCDSPRETIPARFDKHGDMISPEFEVVVSHHVDVHEAGGKTKSISLEQARNAGYIN